MANFENFPGYKRPLRVFNRVVQPCLGYDEFEYYIIGKDMFQKTIIHFYGSSLSYNSPSTIYKLAPKELFISLNEYYNRTYI